MSDLRTAAQQALEVLVQIHPGNMTPMAEEAWNKAIVMLGNSLAEQAEQEHQPWCASLTQLLLSNPPKPAPCNCKPKAEQEPVAWWHRKSNTFTSGNLVGNFAEWTSLYTAPQPAKQPLTDEQIVQLLGGVRESITGNVFFAFARAVERAHGIGEHE